MYLPGKCNKTFKMGEAGSFTFEDGKVRAAPDATSAMRSIASRCAASRRRRCHLAPLLARCCSLPPRHPRRLQTVEVDAKKSAECIPLDEASLKIYDNMIKVRSRHGFSNRARGGFARHAC